MNCKSCGSAVFMIQMVVLMRGGMEVQREFVCDECFVMLRRADVGCKTALADPMQIYIFQPFLSCGFWYVNRLYTEVN